MRRCRVDGGRSGHGWVAQCGVWDTEQGWGCPWDVLPLYLSSTSPPCPLPCAGPAWRWPVEELVGAVGLCGVPAPLTAHVPQVRGAAAQPDVSWAGENQGGGLLPPGPSKPGCCTLPAPGPSHLTAPGVGASLLCLPAPQRWGWPLTGGVGCLCSHCLRPGPPDAIHGGAVGLAAHLDVVPHPWS